MNMVLLLSIVIQVFALAWSLVLLKRMRDWRLSFLTAMLGLMLIRPVIELLQFGTGLVGNQLAGLSALTASVLAAFGVVFVSQMFHERATTGKKSAEALPETTRALQVIIDSSPLAIVVLGSDHKVKLWSPAAERMFGWSASEVIGQPLPIVPDEEREAFEGMINMESKGVDRQGLELRRLKRDGSLIDVSLWTASLRDTTGEVNAILGIITDITEHKRALEAVKASGRRFRSLIENSWDGISLSQPDGTCTYVSPSITRILGYSPDEFVGHKAAEFMHPEEAAELLRAIGPILQTPGSSNCLRHRMQHKDGSWRWMEVVGTNLLDDPNVRAVVVNFHDITERKLAEETLCEREALLKAIFDGTTDFIYVNDLQTGKCRMINPAGAAFFGLPVEEVIGKSGPELFAPETAQWIQEAHRQLVATRSSQTSEGLVESLNGRAAICWTKEGVYTDKDGNVLGLFGIARDITERCLAEKRLRESRERFELAVRGATDGVWDVNVETDETYVSDRWCELMGYQRDEIPGAANLKQWVFAQIHPDDFDSVTDAVRRHLELREPYGVEFRMRTKTGEFRWFYSRGQAAWDPQGRATRFAGCLTEVTERRQAEEEIRQTRDRLRQILDSQFGFVFVLTLDGVIVETNQTPLTLMGLSRADVLGRRCWEVGWVEPGAESQAQATIEAAGRGEIVRGDVSVRFPGLGRRDVDAVFHPLRDESGTVINVVAFGVDITERKLAEQALRTSEARLREAHRLAGLGAWELNTASHAIWWSEEQYRLNGVEPGTPITQSYFLSLIHPEDRSRFDEAFNLLIAQGRIELEYRLVRPDCAVRHMYGIASVIRDGEGRPIRMCGTNQDITERRQADEKLRLSEAKYHALFDNAVEGFFQTTPKGVFLNLNQALASIYGFASPADVIVHFQDIGTQLYVDPKRRQGFVRLMEVHGKVGAFEFEIYRKDGSHAWVSESARAVHDADGQLLWYEGTVEDITERKLAEEALVESRNRLEFLSRQLITTQENERKNLARELHDEIGQTLTAVRMLCETGTCPAGPQVLDLVTELMGRVRNLSFDLRPPMLDPLGLLPAVLWKIERYSERTRIRVAFQHSGVERRFASELEVAAYRIIQEALTNVARHAGVPEATVQLWADTDTLGIQVTDRGKGFDPDAVMAAGQTGGLTGILERVELLGGEIAIESTPGQGTFLTVQFPLAACSENHEGKQ